MKRSRPEQEAPTTTPSSNNGENLETPTKKIKKPSKNSNKQKINNTTNSEKSTKKSTKKTKPIGILNTKTLIFHTDFDSTSISRSSRLTCTEREKNEDFITFINLFETNYLHLLDDESSNAIYQRGTSHSFLPIMKMDDKTVMISRTQVLTYLDSSAIRAFFCIENTEGTPVSYSEGKKQFQFGRWTVITCRNIRDGHNEFRTETNKLGSEKDEKKRCFWVSIHKEYIMVQMLDCGIIDKFVENRSGCQDIEQVRQAVGTPVEVFKYCLLNCHRVQETPHIQPVSEPLPVSNKEGFDSLQEYDNTEETSFETNNIQGDDVFEESTNYNLFDTEDTNKTNDSTNINQQKIDSVQEISHIQPVSDSLPVINSNEEDFDFLQEYEQTKETSNIDTISATPQQIDNTYYETNNIQEDNVFESTNCNEFDTEDTNKNDDSTNNTQQEIDFDIYFYVQ